MIYSNMIQAADLVKYLVIGHLLVNGPAAADFPLYLRPD